LPANNADGEHVWLHHTLETPVLDGDGNIDWELMWLYRRRRGVTQLRPIFTGDVFKGIIPIGETEQATLIVLQHPCALSNERNELRDVLLAAKIVDHPEVAVSQWVGNYDLMPLVVLDSKPPQHQAIAFNELALVRTADLELHRRIACMEIEGIAVLLQRWTNVNTRVVVPRWRFEQVIEPQRAEAEGIENWWTERNRAGVPMAVALSEAAAFLDAKSAAHQVGPRSSSRTGQPGCDRLRRAGMTARLNRGCPYGPLNLADMAPYCPNRGCSGGQIGGVYVAPGGTKGTRQT
jgi:hypothetical protein